MNRQRARLATALLAMHLDPAPGLVEAVAFEREVQRHKRLFDGCLRARRIRASTSDMGADLPFQRP